MKKTIYIFATMLCCSLALWAQQGEAAAPAAQGDEVSRPDSVFMAHDDTAAGLNYTKTMADSLYAAGDYVTAAQIYETLLQHNGPAAALYYNLGNAYYKLNDMARAILNYERVLLLEPGSNDARFNLELAQSKTVDKVDKRTEFFLVTWMNSLINSLSADGWGTLAIATFLLLLVSLAAVIFGKRISLRRTGLAVALLALALCIVSNLFAYKQMQKITNRNTAIVVAPSVTVRSTPSDSGTQLFVIHEGHKVTITDDTMRGWKEIEIEGGNVGWIPVEAIEII